MSRSAKSRVSTGAGRSAISTSPLPPDPVPFSSYDPVAFAQQEFLRMQRLHEQQQQQQRQQQHVQSAADQDHDEADVEPVQSDDVDAPEAVAPQPEVAASTSYFLPLLIVFFAIVAGAYFGNHPISISTAPVSPVEAEVEDNHSHRAVTLSEYNGMQASWAAVLNGSIHAVENELRGLPEFSLCRVPTELDFTQPLNQMTACPAEHLKVDNAWNDWLQFKSTDMNSERAVRAAANTNAHAQTPTATSIPDSLHSLPGLREADATLDSFKHAEVAFKAATRAKAVVQAESDKSAVVIRSRASSAVALAKQRAVFYVSFHVVATAFQQANAAIASLNTTADNIARTQQKLEAFVAQHSSELAHKAELQNALNQAQSEHATAQQAVVNAQAKVQQYEQRLPQITSSLVTARAQFETHQADMVSHALELDKVEEEVKTLSEAVKKEEAMVKAAADKEQKYRSYLELLDRYTGAHSLDLDAEIAAKQAEIEKAKAEVEAEALASKDVMDEQRSVQNHVLDEMVALIRNSQATLQQKVTSAEQGLQQLLGLQRLLQKSTSDFAAMRENLDVQLTSASANAAKLHSADAARRAFLITAQNRQKQLRSQATQSHVRSAELQADEEKLKAQHQKIVDSVSDLQKTAKAAAAAAERTGARVRDAEIAVRNFSSDIVDYEQLRDSLNQAVEASKTQHDDVMRRLFTLHTDASTLGALKQMKAHVKLIAESAAKHRKLMQDSEVAWRIVLESHDALHEASVALKALLAQ